MKNYVITLTCGHAAQFSTVPLFAPKEGDVTRCKRCSGQMVTIIQVVERGKKKEIIDGTAIRQS